MALVARRENRLRDVADIAYQLGSPDVAVIQGDVSRAEDCERFVDRTIDHFGRCKHVAIDDIFSSIIICDDWVVTSAIFDVIRFVSGQWITW